MRDLCHRWSQAESGTVISSSDSESESESQRNDTQAVDHSDVSNDYNWINTRPIAYKCAKLVGAVYTSKLVSFARRLAGHGAIGSTRNSVNALAETPPAMPK
jgi:hypothetical protein